MDQGDTITAKNLIREAANKGCSLAEIFSMVPDRKDLVRADAAKLAMIGLDGMVTTKRHLPRRIFLWLTLPYCQKALSWHIILIRLIALLQANTMQLYLSRKLINVWCSTIPSMRTWNQSCKDSSSGKNDNIKNNIREKATLQIYKRLHLPLYYH